MNINPEGLAHNGRFVIYREVAGESNVFCDIHKKIDMSIEIHPAHDYFLEDLESTKDYIEYLESCSDYSRYNFWFEPVFEKVVADV